MQEKNHKLSDPGVCLFLLSALCGFPCVERVAVFCWLSCAASSFRCFCASCCRSMSVLKKPTSVVAEASALTVTVLTCFSSASLCSKSVFKGAVEDRPGFCGFLAFSHMRPSPPLAQAAFRSVLDAACSVYVFCARFWDTTMVCCMWSGILCRVFMIR